jgi:hypothetical protein
VPVGREGSPDAVPDVGLVGRRDWTALGGGSALEMGGRLRSEVCVAAVVAVVMAADVCDGGRSIVALVSAVAEDFVRA